jgi:K+-transporting ATPase A subunit
MAPLFSLCPVLNRVKKNKMDRKRRGALNVINFDFFGFVFLFCVFVPQRLLKIEPRKRRRKIIRMAVACRYKAIISF